MAFGLFQEGVWDGVPSIAILVVLSLAAGVGCAWEDDRRSFRRLRRLEEIKREEFGT